MVELDYILLIPLLACIIKTMMQIRYHTLPQLALKSRFGNSILHRHVFLVRRGVGLRLLEDTDVVNNVDALY